MLIIDSNNLPAKYVTQIIKCKLNAKNITIQL